MTVYRLTVCGMDSVPFKFEISGVGDFSEPRQPYSSDGSHGGALWLPL